MKLLTTDLIAKLAVSMLLAIQVPAVIAGDNNLAAKESAAQEQNQAVRENGRSTDLERHRFEQKDETNNTQAKRKTGGYVSIISVIINDALGHATRKVQARRSNAAGKISF